MDKLEGVLTQEDRKIIFVNVKVWKYVLELNLRPCGSRDMLCQLINEFCTCIIGNADYVEVLFF